MPWVSWFKNFWNLYSWGAIMEPSGIDFGSVYTTIGSALGTPVTLVVFWVASKIKELQTEVKLLKKKENAAVKEDITDIRVNVSWMRVKLSGGLVPYPGNGKRFETVDASKFKPYRGLVSRGEDYGESFDGIGYTNAIKSATRYDMESPEAHKELLKRNYKALMGQ